MSEPELNQYTVSYLRDLFRNYYRNNPVANPIAIETREVGIGEFGKKISSRHISFRDVTGLNKYLVEKTPFFVSYSVGYYKHPDRRPMENKELFGADIVYEFDADDFDLPCKNEHDVWFCKSCQAFGNGHKDVCPECQGKTEIIEWVCDKCLGHAKKETLRLMDFLETDFNLDPKTFIISFSGSKGYHLRVTDKSIIPLSKSSRLQMMNYILGKNLDLKLLGFEFKDKQWFCPSPKSLGLSSKLLTFLKEYIQETTKEQLINDFNLTKAKATKIIDNKEVILNKMDYNILWHGFSKDSKSDAKFWEDLLNLAISKISFRIDPMSSSDIYKIMRMPETIHGGTGLLSSLIKTREDLEKFDPFSDAVIFREDKVKRIEITRPINKFKFLNKEYGPYSLGERLDLPEAVSVYLLLKGVCR